MALVRCDLLLLARVMASLPPAVIRPCRQRSMRPFQYHLSTHVAAAAQKPAQPVYGASQPTVEVTAQKTQVAPSITTPATSSHFPVRQRSGRRASVLTHHVERWTLSILRADVQDPSLRVETFDNPTYKALGKPLGTECTHRLFEGLCTLRRGR